MLKYYHGSKDSLDVDVFYVFDEMPSPVECKLFCSDEQENRNIIVIKDGFVTKCYKGTVDEIQNSLIATYPLHKQEYPLIISEKVERIAILKAIRVMRCFLSHFSRTSFRPIVKEALASSSWGIRLGALSKLKLTNTDFGKNGTCTNVRKIFAFQLAQILGLMSGREIYTKHDAAEAFPPLRPYLYRDETADTMCLENAFELFTELLKDVLYIQVGDNIKFIKSNITIDLKNEKIIS